MLMGRLLADVCSIRNGADNPFPKTRGMGSVWVRNFVLGSRSTLEDK